MSDFPVSSFSSILSFDWFRKNVEWSFMPRDAPAESESNLFWDFFSVFVLVFPVFFSFVVSWVFVSWFVFLYFFFLLFEVLVFGSSHCILYNQTSLFSSLYSVLLIKRYNKESGQLSYLARDLKVLPCWPCFLFFFFLISCYVKSYFAI